VLQVAVTLVLLTSAGLLLNSFTRLLRVDPGFEPQEIVTLDIGLPAGRYAESHRVIAFYDELISRIGSADGVEAVSGSNLVPLTFWPLIREVVIESEDVQEYPVYQVEYRQVTRGYFHTFGISVVEGRGFEVTDSRDSPAVAVVNQTFVRKLLPEGRALGRRVRIEPRKLSSGWTQIIGVVEDVKQHRIDQEVDPEIYQLHTQAPEPARSLTLSMRTRLPPADILDATRSELRALDPAVPVLGLEPMKTFVDYGLGGHRLAVFLTGLFAALALTLTLVGLYGLIAYRVSQRAQEIGLRMALGATPRQIMREILERGLGLVALGVGLGVIASVISSRALQRLLFGVKPHDPVILLIVIAVMFLVTTLACYVPARRIYRVDPGVALHYE
jgi:predicted permease